ncbi:MAG TPA: competence/damage-inducible protein A [Ignavibacteria bacterium]|nr:competence/damage-inducible protein A [Ignavibacteria bacterium]
MNAKVISIGDEILIGQIVNTNASFIAEKLYSIGIPVSKIITIGDNEQDLLDELKESEEKFDVTIITGGLGPTHDDLTKPVLLKYFNDELVIDEKVLKHVKKMFASRNVEMPKSNIGQAEVPKNSRVIWNNNGTAPGIWIEKNNKVYAALPGVPYEMKPMVTDFVLPELQKIFKDKFDNYYFSRTILTTGISESALFEKIGDIKEITGENKMAFLPSADVIRLRIDIKAKDKKSAEAEFNKIQKKLEAKISEYMFGYDEDKMEKLIGDLLIKKKLKLAVAESCTGGNISFLIVNIPGSSEYYLGGVCTYANEAKQKMLGVKKETLESYGAVSEKTAIEMAEGARKEFKADVAISTTGIAGPAGGTEAKPVGLVYIGYSDKNKSFAEKFYFGDNRMKNISRATIAAMNILRKELLKL